MPSPTNRMTFFARRTFGSSRPSLLSRTSRAPDSNHSAAVPGTFSSAPAPDANASTLIPTVAANGVMCLPIFISNLPTLWMHRE